MPVAQPVPACLVDQSDKRETAASIHDAALQVHVAIDVCIQIDRSVQRREHGADLTINYSTEDLRERLKVLTDEKGPDVIYDPVGGQYAEPAFRSIGWRGRYLVVGFANGEIPKLPLNLMLLKGASVVGVFWGQFVSKEPQHFKRDVQEMFEWVQEGKLRPHISARYPLAQGAQAITDMMNRKVMGKVVITA